MARTNPVIDTLMRPPFQVDSAWYEAHWLTEKPARIGLFARAAAAIRWAGRLAYASIYAARRSATHLPPALRERRV